MSGSLIFGQLQRSFATLPLFSYDGGVVLRPSGVSSLCLYGADGSTDQAGQCERAILGWCSPSDLPLGTDPMHHPACGFDMPRGWRSGVSPWRNKDAALALDYQSRRGAGNATTPWTGYNEAILEPWDDTGIEFFFIVDCERNEANKFLPKLNMVVRLAHTCDEAHAAGRRTHAAFLREHGLTNASFPLLMLRRNNWAEPFARA